MHWEGWHGDPYLSAETIAEEWIRQTFSNDNATVATVKQMMLSSHENAVNYMTPLGLHHIMGYGHHYGPAPWFNNATREDWNCTYFHRADSIGIGFDRTVKGSNALAQYAAPFTTAMGGDQNNRRSVAHLVSSCTMEL